MTVFSTSRGVVVFPAGLWPVPQPRGQGGYGTRAHPLEAAGRAAEPRGGTAPIWGDRGWYYIGTVLSRRIRVRAAGPPLDWAEVASSASPLRRIGLFGGTFDPPHVGHLVTAVNVRYALGLDVVVLMVANDPWQKRGGRTVSAAVDRLAMVEAAVADVDGLEAGRDEIDAGGPSYTADTLAVLAARHPSAELFTIVGDDAAAGFTTWERHAEVARRSTLVVVDRPGEPVHLPHEFDWVHVGVPRLEVSSTDLRARCSDGRPLDYLVTEPVLDVIRRRHLYGSPG